MDWVTEHLDEQRSAVEQQSAEIKKQLELKERFRNQMPSVWDKISAAFEGDVLRLNAAGYSLQLKTTPTMIQVCPQGEIRALVILEIDPTTGRIRYNCPVPPRQPGVPRIGEFQIQAGVSQGHILGQRVADGPVETFTPEQVSEFLLKPAISSK